MMKNKPNVDMVVVVYKGASEKLCDIFRGPFILWHKCFKFAWISRLTFCLQNFDYLKSLIYFDYCIDSIMQILTNLLP